MVGVGMGAAPEPMEWHMEGLKGLGVGDGKNKLSLTLKKRQKDVHTQFLYRGRQNESSKKAHKRDR